ncbi:aldehyde dehydrogenase family protein [Marinobacterium sediminicola]|uniref:Phenylacetaldehyde dehydrogenase n=1 Tax=Marinobacterium sediminicola TaxID=518898 RepID=A0ABY1RYQ6_9GAMM|nr:aldehyde dehydrogenase family protein [Marinobacterium sediminicola]ULG68042.1 aldehyde dehydrogenase family protein [Marinobacterium sediminicola]SMR73448.1 phenylacetaldehyde dehydrogenase [Marinobacterium sediminicola]
MTEFSLHPHTQAFIKRNHALLIGDQRLGGSDGGTIDVINPATGDKLTQVARGTAADINKAVATARRTFEDSAWSRMTPVERERLLWRYADLIEANAQSLAEIECLDNGKSAAIAEAVDIQLAVNFLRYMAGWATKIDGSSVKPSVPFMPGAQFHGYTTREPVGVVGAIVAWNFPLLLACWKLGPALATGCTVVLKPAEDTPLTALRLGELALEAGYPAGVLNVVPGLGHDAGAALSAHPDVDKLTFTGSTGVGKMIGKAAMDHMTRVTLELGGKSPTIVLDDADPREAAAGAANAIFFNQGQVCCAGSRLYVQRKLFDNLVADITDIASNIRLGNGLDPDTEMGPLVSAVQQQRVHGFIEKGLAEGARITTGGGTQGPGFFVQPTVIVDVDQRSTLVQEEIFGPVLVAMPFDDIEDAIRIANDSQYGLGASIWSNNLSAVHRMVPRIKSGSVWVNCHTALDPSLPFGGFKQSGLGREMGAACIEHYTEIKSVLMKV